VCSSDLKLPDGSKKILERSDSILKGLIADNAQLLGQARRNAIRKSGMLGARVVKNTPEMNREMTRLAREAFPR
jgi:hypothetical protein